jgi:hypothetical protein
MWNMPREGFIELYEQVNWKERSYPPPSSFTPEDAWLITGGKPYMLAKLAEAQWSPEKVARRTVSLRKLQYFVKLPQRRREKVAARHHRGPGHALHQRTHPTTQQASKKKTCSRRHLT